MADSWLPTGRVRRAITPARLIAEGAALAAVAKARALRGGDTKDIATELANDEKLTGAALRMARQLGEMKGAAMKIGQVLSFIDLGVVPEQFRGALAALQADAPPMPYAMVEEVVEEELGARPEAIFDFFSPVPIASASIGQVHMAHRGSEELVVKVQYPGVAKAIESDLRNAALLALPVAGAAAAHGRHARQGRHQRAHRGAARAHHRGARLPHRGGQPAALRRPVARRPAHRRPGGDPRAVDAAGDHLGVRRRAAMVGGGRAAPGAARPVGHGDGAVPARVAVRQGRHQPRPAPGQLPLPRRRPRHVPRLRRVPAVRRGPAHPPRRARHRRHRGHRGGGARRARADGHPAPHRRHRPRPRRAAHPARHGAGHDRAPALRVPARLRVQAGLAGPRLPDRPRQDPDAPRPSTSPPRCR